MRYHDCEVNTLNNVGLYTVCSTYQSVDLHLISVDELLASESKVVCSNIERSRNLNNLLISLCLVSVGVHSLVLIDNLLVCYCVDAYV
jgi:hypothetical protein